ncbi:hypothetical protein KAJ89_03665 [Candidatus Parcubacteria bacterium]|nr:hypothetical protein [Candidatus Parcubacteria bacterium]
MAKNKTLIYLLALIIGFTVTTSSLLAAFVPVPIVIAVDQSVSQTRPLITGLTAPGTEVSIYINGTFSKLAEVNETETATNNFYYSLENNLDSGEYSLTAIARDKTSLVLSTFSTPVDFLVPELSAPTLLVPNKNSVIGETKPLITGLSESDTTVHVFIDGIINGNTGIINNETGTADFVYQPFLNLSVGQHQAWAVAVSEDGRTSKLSNVLDFNIEAPMPAPTLMAPVVNSSSTHEQPFIVGLTKNDSLIKVFIDGNLDGEFISGIHASGTVSFAYQPFLPLSRGQHQIYVTATDSRGKISIWSNSINYFVGEPVISPIAAEEEIAVLSSESVFGTDFKDLIILAQFFQLDPSVSLSVDQSLALEKILSDEELLQKLSAGDKADLRALAKAKIFEDSLVEESAIDTPKDSKEAIFELDKILSEKQEVAEEQSGLINEDKERQGRLRWNLVIFILFLVAVIIWIFWVNRELIKEKQEQGKSK